MNSKKNLILLYSNGQLRDKTAEIERCEYNSYTQRYDIKFYNSNRVYPYGYNSVEWYRNPKCISPEVVKISHGDIVLFNIESIYVFNDEYWHVIFSGNPDIKERTYHKRDLKIEFSCLESAQAKSVFNYLKSIANEISVKTEDDNKILANQYASLENYIGEDTVAAKYLNPAPLESKTFSGTVIFPFGSNASQTQAVYNALENNISIIEGPPGTGKTQTILNIIANLVIRGRNVEIVSNNNSATENVYEKLCKYGYGFIVAPLGKDENKTRFIETQTGTYPDLTDWNIKVEDYLNANNRIAEVSSQLNDIFDNQRKLAELKHELSSIETEKVYFDKYCEENDIPDIVPRRKVKSDKILNLWMKLENSSRVSLYHKVRFLLCYPRKSKTILDEETERIIAAIKKSYYPRKVSELCEHIAETEKLMEGENSKELLDEFTALSQKVFKYHLYNEYGKRNNRRIFEKDDLWKKSREFVNEYPVVLSTTYSSRSSLGKGHIYDYVIMDEASQVDVATGTLAMSCARNAVIVGDRKQLPNVVTEVDKQKTKQIFDMYNINEGYDFSEHSFLDSVCRLLPDVKTTLLREHYRCHPKIIEFCNQKFYNGQLIIMTEDNGEMDVMKVYKTNIGNHARGRYSQRQIDEITNHILPDISDKDIGIITPYRDQVKAITEQVDSNILTATVHKFQGKEKDVIIMSTVDDVITEFSDDANLINVAVSRAVNKFRMVVNPDEQNKNTNIGDLVQYIERNNFEVVESDINSIFDYLYIQYQEEKKKYLDSSKKISVYDSENLMYKFLTELLQEQGYHNLGVISHLSLRELFKNKDKLTEEELLYISRESTHVDFMIYNKLSKMPVLGIEVDGFNYHKEGTKQHERDIMKDTIFEKYGLPLLRLKTNGSREKEIITEKLNSIYQHY